MTTVGKYILTSGPIVQTREVGRIYAKEKGIAGKIGAAELYETFCKHLNISQIYVFGKAYLIANCAGCNISNIVATLKSMVHGQEIVKEVVRERLSSKFVSMLQYIDTPRD